MNPGITLRGLDVALRAVLLFTLLCGAVYPAAVTVIGGLTMRSQATGQMLSVDGEVVGSRLIGQQYLLPDGSPDPAYLQGRPSAAGDDGYDPTSSSGTNDGPENPDLIENIESARAADEELGRTGEAPPDALTASSSGLDPHISPANAAGQAARIAAERGISEDQVTQIVAEHTVGRELGVLGEPRVNVLDVNIALDEEFGRP